MWDTCCVRGRLRPKGPHAWKTLGTNTNDLGRGRMGLAQGGPAAKLTWRFTEMSTSSGPPSLTLRGASWHLRFLYLPLPGRLQIHPVEEGKLSESSACTQSLESFWAIRWPREVWYFQSSSALLSVTPVLAERVGLIYGGLLETMISCVFVRCSLYGLLNRHSDSGAEAYASQKEADAA